MGLIQTRVTHERYGDMSKNAVTRIPGQMSAYKPTDGTVTDDEPQEDIT